MPVPPWPATADGNLHFYRLPRAGDGIAGRGAETFENGPQSINALTDQRNGLIATHPSRPF